MKRCPECRRDYFDDSLIYCLDDGNALLEGPRAGPVVGEYLGSEPPTAIRHDAPPPDEAPTRAQIHSTENTAVLPAGLTHPAKTTRLSKHVPIALLALAVIAFGGFFAYKRFGPSGARISSVAVMPFTNESGNSEIEYLGDGMTETLIKGLSALPGAEIRPRSTVFRYKGKDEDLATIANELGVEAILNGTISQHGDQVRISLELVEAGKNRVVWAEAYERKLSELVSLQTELAKDVAAKLSSKLSSADEGKVTHAGTANGEAYNHYLRALFYWNKQSYDAVETSIKFYQKAIELDPNYAEAFAGLAISSLWTGKREEAKVAASKALALNDDLPRAHLALGVIGLSEYDWLRSEASLRRSVELDPGDPMARDFLGLYFSMIGKHAEAENEVKSALALDPTSFPFNRHLATCYVFARDYDRAAVQLKGLLEMEPQFVYAFVDLGEISLHREDYPNAIFNFKRALELEPEQAGPPWG